MWKPGQCVTINHKTYRIIKTKFTCTRCAFKNLEPSVEPCNTCAEGKLLPPNTALSRIYNMRDFGLPKFKDIEEELENL